MTTTADRPADQVSPQVEARAGRTHPWLWLAVLVPALCGIAFTTIQIMERIQVMERPETPLSCDINAKISCSGVLEAWQSSVLGPPNALIGAVMFAFLASAGLGGLLRNVLSRAYLLTVWGLALFFLCFATWFMYETAFVIHLLCVWCAGIVTAVIVICGALTRLVDRYQALGDGAAGRALATVVGSRLDLILWVGWWLVLAEMLWLGLHR